jgi:ABC-type bacteriocin/lantibiotic exporter with double-glycine peptidase domain
VLAPVALIFLFGALCQSPPPEACAADVSYWRTMRWSGANSLYMLMKSHAVECDYADVQRYFATDQPSYTLHELAEISERLGLPAVVTTPDFAALQRGPLPVIAHIEGLEEGVDYRRTGRLVLICRITSEHVICYDCVTALQELVVCEDFLRLWSGACVAVTPISAARALAWSLGGTGLLGLAWLLLRRIR